MASAPEPQSTGDDFADIFAGSDWDGWQKISEINTRIAEAERAAAAAASRGALYSDDLNMDYFQTTFGRGLARGKNTLDANALLGTTDDAQLAEILREAGIPGLRYFDGNSRGAGEGTRNYVVWDDSIIEILRRYGIVPPVAAGGYGLLSNDAEAGQ